MRGPSGRRLGSVEVVAIHDTAHSSSTYSGESDLNGAWTINDLPPGAYTVCISAEGASSAADPTGGRSTCLHRIFDVVAGAGRIGVDHTLAPAGAVSGTITDSSGRPIADASVMVIHGRGINSVVAATTSGRDGHFRMTGLTPGSYRVCGEIDYATGAGNRRCLTNQVTVVARKVTHTADIALPATASLIVSVHDGAGHALAGVDVAVLRACPQGGCPTQPVFSSTTPVRTIASQTTGIAGRAVFRGLRPGHYAVCALAYYAASAAPVPDSGFADKCAGNTFSVTLTRGNASSETMSLDPGAAATGVVQDTHGNPLADVAVHIGRSAAFDYRNGFPFNYPSSPSPRTDVRTDATGHYLIRSIVPGSRTVCGVAPRRLRVRRTCLSGPVSLTASTTAQAPTLVMNPAAAARAQRVHLAAPMRRVTLPTARVFPQNRRIPVITSNGWPEFRLLPRTTP